MFFAFAIEGFAEVECLFPYTELDFHGPAGAVDRGELTHFGRALLRLVSMRCQPSWRRPFGQGCLPLSRAFLRRSARRAAVISGAVRMATRRQCLPLLDLSEFGEAEITHISQNKVAAANFNDEFLADGFVLFGGGLQAVGDDGTG